jgi:hypothetical protein
LILRKQNENDLRLCNLAATVFYIYKIGSDTNGVEMNIKELAEQAGFDSKSQTVWAFDNFDLERFAELIRKDERESCAKLLDDFSNTSMVPAKDTWRYGVKMAANCVRDKNEH